MLQSANFYKSLSYLAMDSSMFQAIDLSSDTARLPILAMKQVMLEAELGYEHIIL